MKCDALRQSRQRSASDAAGRTSPPSWESAGKVDVRSLPAEGASAVAALTERAMVRFAIAVADSPLGDGMKVGGGKAKSPAAFIFAKAK